MRETAMSYFKGRVDTGPLYHQGGEGKAETVLAPLERAGM